MAAPDHCVGGKKCGRQSPGNLINCAMPLTAAEVASHVGGKVIGDGSIPLTGFAAADYSRPGDLTFAENDTYFARAEASAASAILVADSYSSAEKVLILVPNARVAYARVLPLFFPQAQFNPGVHASAVVATSAQIDPSAHIGPHCDVGELARVGPGTAIQTGSYVGANCQLGEHVRLFPRVTLYPGTQIGNRVSIHAGTVIGSDGFGYV